MNVQAYLTDHPHKNQTRRQMYSHAVFKDSAGGVNEILTATFRSEPAPVHAAARHLLAEVYLGLGNTHYSQVTKVCGRGG